jgi:hypothetical protein
MTASGDRVGDVLHHLERLTSVVACERGVGDGRDAAAPAFGCPRREPAAERLSQASVAGRVGEEDGLSQKVITVTVAHWQPAGQPRAEGGVRGPIRAVQDLCRQGVRDDQVRAEFWEPVNRRPVAEPPQLGVGVIGRRWPFRRGGGAGHLVAACGRSAQKAASAVPIGVAGGAPSSSSAWIPRHSAVARSSARTDRRPRSIRLRNT